MREEDKDDCAFNEGKGKAFSRNGSPLLGGGITPNAKKLQTLYRSEL